MPPRRAGLAGLLFALVAGVSASPGLALAYFTAPKDTLNVAAASQATWIAFDPAWYASAVPKGAGALVLTKSTVEFGTCDNAEKPTFQYIKIADVPDLSALSAPIPIAATLVPAPAAGGINQVALMDSAFTRVIAITNALQVTGGTAPTAAWLGAAAPQPSGATCPTPTGTPVVKPAAAGAGAGAANPGAANPPGAGAGAPGAGAAGQPAPSQAAGAAGAEGGSASQPAPSQPAGAPGSSEAPPPGGTAAAGIAGEGGSPAQSSGSGAPGAVETGTGSSGDSGTSSGDGSDPSSSDGAGSSQSGASPLQNTMRNAVAAVGLTMLVAASSCAYVL